VIGHPLDPPEPNGQDRQESTQFEGEIPRPRPPRPVDLADGDRCLGLELEPERLAVTRDDGRGGF
jgi:hypothetical protein